MARIRKSVGITAISACLLLSLMTSCRNTFSREEAVAYTLKSVQFPGDGGKWETGKRTLHFWAKVPKALVKSPNGGTYEVFALFIERSYASIKSCSVPVDYLRITVDPGRRNPVMTFEIPFDCIQDYFRSTVPSSSFWDQVLVREEPLKDWPPTTPEILTASFASGLMYQDALTLLDEGESCLSVDWDERRGWLEVGLELGHGIGDGKTKATIRKLVGIMDRRCKQLGLEYSGVSFVEWRGNQKQLKKSFTRSALNAYLSRTY